MQYSPIKLSRMEEGATVRNSGNACGDPEVLNSQGLGNLLVLFWTRSESKFDYQGRDVYFEYTIDPNKYHIIGCDEDQTRQLLLYKSNFVGFPNRICVSDNPKGVIERVFTNNSPEMSPNILHYSEVEYPHRDFAFSCGIRSSFCFPFETSAKSGIMEIVSTCNQDVVTLKKFCQSFLGFVWSSSFPNINVQDYAIKEIDHFLEVVSQTFHLPLTQCWRYLEPFTFSVHQFSHRDFENLAPWCHFKDACFHTRLCRYKAPLGSSCENSAAFFCRNMTTLSITQYPLAHYARNCGSISCFTIFLGSYGLPGKEWALEFFLPAQEMDNYYPQNLLSSIWVKMKEWLPYCKRQVLSVKVMNSSTRNEPKFFELGQHDSSLPHHEGSEYTPTLHLFFNGTEYSSNSNSYEEGVTGKTSKRLPHQVTEITLDMFEEESRIKHIEPHSLVCQPKRPVDILEYEGNTVEIDHSTLGMTLEEPSKLKNHTVTAERVANLVEVSPDDGIEYDATTASKRLKKSKIPFTVDNISKHFGRPLKDAAASFGVSTSTLKRRCRSVNITWWQPGKRKLIDTEKGKQNVSSSIRPLQDTPVISHKSQALDKTTVKATYNGVTIKFELTNFSGISELEDNVIKRLHLERNSFSIKYQDHDNDLILIGCDEDVQECMKFSRTAEKTTIKMLIHPHVNHYAP